MATRIENNRTLSLLTVALLSGLCATSAQAAQNTLPSLKLDSAKTTVSGLSSGAYMAHQLHLAYSDRIAGAALLAGGPYHCAEGKLETALARCMMPIAGKEPDLKSLTQQTRALAEAGKIAKLSGLAGDRVLVMHGTEDKTVAASLSRDVATLYRDLAPKAVVTEDLTRKIPHTFPTVSEGSSCAIATAPYIGKCAYDGAGGIFEALLGKPHHSAKTASGELRSFDQDAYRLNGADAFLGDEGYVYIPKTCADGETCSLHIALHGCQQNAGAIGDTFARETGYNRWADVYNVVVLYPQTRASMAPLNPKGCWDWWGYSGENYDTRDGAQMQAIARMSAALGAPLR